MPSRLNTAPAGVPRLGLSRQDAAFLVGVSIGTFDKMVAQGAMPGPRRAFGTRKLWLRAEVEQAMFALPEAAETAPNPWDEVA